MILLTYGQNDSIFSDNGDPHV